MGAQDMLLNRVQIEAALRPFAEVKLPTGDDGEDIWLYVGNADPNGTNPPHLTLEDFRRVRQVMGGCGS